MAVDVHIAALLDESAVTIEACYEASPKRYTYVCNIPGVAVGDTVLVPSAATEPARPADNYQKAKAVAVKVSYGQVPPADELWDAIGQSEALEAVKAEEKLATLPWFKAVRVMAVHDTVTIEPGCDVRLNWVAAKVDASGYTALMARNAEIQTAVAEAYKTNVRRSFKTQVLGGLEGDAAGKLLALLAPSPKSTGG